jgi:Family of unknown function (DUF5723)
MKNRFPFVIFWAAWACTTAHAQEQLGMRLERPAGTFSLALNPAMAAYNPAGWDVAVFSFDVFGQQTYGYVRDARIGDVLRYPDRLVSAADLSPERPTPPLALVQDFYGPEKGLAYGVAQGRLAGPGFTARIGERHTIGLVTAARGHTSCYRLPAELRYQPSIDLQFGQPVLSRPVTISGMAWGEVGLHYGYRNFDGDVLFSAGVTPKYLLGWQAGFARVRDEFEYTRLSNDTVRFRNGDWAYGLTTDLAYAEDPASVRPQVNGRGVGIDLGVSWAAPAADGSGPEDYAWRAGVSLLDVGGIRFGRNAEQHRVRFDTTLVIDVDALGNAPDAQALIRRVSRAFLADSLRSQSGTAFSMTLPTALSGQFDLKINELFYASAVVVQRIPLSRTGLRRANTLAVVPRLEHRWVSVSIPVVLTDYRRLHLGAAARLGWLYVGTDDLLSWMARRDLRGGDVYVGLKINGFSFQKNETRRRSGGGRSGGNRLRDHRRRSQIKCPKF